MQCCNFFSKQKYGILKIISFLTYKKIYFSILSKKYLMYITKYFLVTFISLNGALGGNVVFILQLALLSQAQVQVQVPLKWAQIHNVR